MLPQNERASAATFRESPQFNRSLSPIIIGEAAISKDYFYELANLCREAAQTDNPAVYESTIRLLETAPRKLRRRRRDRADLARPIAGCRRI